MYRTLQSSCNPNRPWYLFQSRSKGSRMRYETMPVGQQQNQQVRADSPRSGAHLSQLPSYDRQERVALSLGSQRGWQGSSWQEIFLSTLCVSLSGNLFIRPLEGDSMCNVASITPGTARLGQECTIQNLLSSATHSPRARAGIILPGKRAADRSWWQGALPELGGLP